ncbi:major facilitator superfamily transporter [Metarhizium robertsii ARSEF 23]|uniref:Major facilitator superfamily transporter n=1 Tax=Metarhizium robertsii (strain ARSEF 23 / ATCC MYA-3075) TaxID=655844 RepID=E9F5Z5_METRA|nr:major facilitator superfamily transporter [Metarhizium robertsii ARSEF 23]EFY96881.2 major facilitator superfamily transporter [Metarhizium robertsii ARSEF 23]
MTMGSRSDFPPGTVELLSRQKSGKEKVTRRPTPSDDPNDPLRWPMWRKLFNFGLLTAMTMAIFTGLAIQSLFFKPLRKELHVTTGQLLTAKAILLSGEAVTCIIFIPLAKKYGRRSLYIVSTAVFTAAVWWTAYMQTATELYLTNLLKGLAGAINETAVQMSIRDMFFVHQRGTANGFYFAALKFGFTLSPMAAGAQATAFGWRSCYMTLAVFMTVLTVVFAVGYEETKFVRPATDDKGSAEDEDAVDCALEKDPDEKRTPQVPFPHYLRLQLLTPTGESLWKTLYQPLFTMAIPQVMFVAVLYGVDLCTITVSGSMKSIIFVEPPYNFTPRELGLMHLGPFIGSILGTLYGGFLIDAAIVWLARRNGGIFEPEMRLYFLPIPALAMAAGMAMFDVAADRGMHWIYPIIGTTLSSFGFGGVADIVFTLIIDSYPDIVSQTFVVITFFRNAIGVIGAFAVEPWRQAMTVSGMFVLIAGVIILVHLVAVPMAIWGKRARAANAERYYRLSQATW